MTVLELLAAVEAVARKRAGCLALIGAYARNAWAPPRATTDLDLVVAADPATIAEIEEALAALGFRCVRRQQVDAADELADILIFRREEGDPRQVDLLVAKSDFEASALSRATAVDVGSLTLPVVTVEDLIVYKLIADRPRDREDIRAVLATQERAGRAIDWSHLERWCEFWGIGDRLARLRSG
jgi:predicted nucleotidyltransferase